MQIIYLYKYILKFFVLFFKYHLDNFYLIKFPIVFSKYINLKRKKRRIIAFEIIKLNVLYIKK